MSNTLAFSSRAPTSGKWDGFPTHGSGEAWLPLSRTAELVSTRDPPALAPAPPGPPVGLGSLEIQGHPDPDLSPRGGTAARSFAPDSARIGPRFQSNPPNSFSSAPCGTSGSLNRSGDRKPWNFKEPVKSGVVSHSRGKTCGKFTLGLPKRLPNRR